MSDRKTTESTDTDADDTELPESVVAEAERLTRRARAAAEDAERRGALRARRRLLADHGFTARVREEESRDVLVLHPEAWVEDGTVRPDRIEDIDRGIERPLSGVGDDDWAAVENHNRELVAAVERVHGPVHGANAQALADFAGNHYKKRIEQLSGEELALFLEEYYRRNVWPTDDQRSAVEKSVRLVFEQADEPVPTWRSR